MAKKRKKRLNGKRRRRNRVGGLGVNLGNVGAVVVGAVAAGYINKIIPATVNDKVVAGGKVLLGILIPMVSKDAKTKGLLAAAGAGMIAVGSVDLLKSFGALSGDFDIPVINGDVLTGEDLDVINGIEEAEHSEVHGEEEELNGEESED